MAKEIETLAQAKAKIGRLEKELLEAQERIKVLEGVVYTLEKSDTFGDLVKEVERLRKRELDLLHYNNEQVEKRRELATKLYEERRNNKNDGIRN